MPSGVIQLQTLSVCDVPDLNELPVEIAKVRWIRNSQELNELADRLNQVSSYAIDTETGAAIDPRTGLPNPLEALNAHLSLIQIALGESEIYIVDVVALSSEGLSEDWSVLDPLRDSLTNPQIEKVVHFSSFEREQFARYGIELSGIYDTFTQAQRFRPDLPSHTLAACLWEICGIKISKDAQDAPWMMRPLKDEWIEYAARDPVATLLLRKRLAEFEQAVEQERCVDCISSLDAIPEAYARALEEIRSVATDYFLLELRASNLRHAIIDRLKERSARVRDQKAVEYLEHAGDRAAAYRAREYQISFDKLEVLHPAAFNELVEWRVSMHALREYMVAAPLLKSSDQVESVFRKVVNIENVMRIAEFTPAYRELYPCSELGERQELAHYFGEFVSDAAKLYRDIRDQMQLLRPDLKSLGVWAAVNELLGRSLIVDPTALDFQTNLSILRECQRLVEQRIEDAKVDHKSCTVADMCDALLDTKRKQLDIMRRDGLGARYWLQRVILEQHEIDARAVALQLSEGRKQNTIQSANGGVIKVVSDQERRVALEILKQRYPQYYDALVQRNISQHEVRAYLRTRGLSAPEREVVMSALLEQPSFSKEWSVRISPEYGSLYKG